MTGTANGEQEEKKIEIINLECKSFTELIPFLTAFMLFASALSIGSYYFTFGINIFSFLEVSEFTLVFINNFIYVFLIGSIVFLYRTYILNSMPTPKNNKSKKFVNIYAFLYIIIGVILYLIYSDFRSVTFWTLTVSFSLIFTILDLLIGSVLKKTIQITPESKKNHFLDLCTLLLFFIFIMACNSFTSAGYIIDNPKQQVLITLKDTTLSKHEIYIGKTNKYIFFYNDSLKTSLALPLETVKIIKFPKGFFSRPK